MLTDRSARPKRGTTITPDSLREFERLRSERAKRIEAAAQTALHFTDPVEADVKAPTELGVEVEGFAFNSLSLNAHDVTVRWSSSTANGPGWAQGSDGPTNRLTSHGPRDLFSTKLLALRALRHYAAQQFARRLAEIDEAIAAEAASEATTNGGEHG